MLNHSRHSDTFETREQKRNTYPPKQIKGNLLSYLFKYRLPTVHVCDSSRLFDVLSVLDTIAHGIIWQCRQSLFHIVNRSHTWRR